MERTPAASGAGRAAGHSAVPPSDRWLITGFLLVLMAPPEVQFNLGSFVLSPQRIFLIVGLPLALLRVIGEPRLGFRVLDLVAILHAAWIWVAVSKVHGVERAIQWAGSYSVEFLGSYFLGRAATLTPSHVLFFARRLLVFIFAIGLLAIPETLTGEHIIRQAFGRILGPKSLEGVDPRFGLTRAFGPFDHPILYGVFCASAIGLNWYLAPTRRVLGFARLWRAAGVVIAAFASLSTGPLLACTVQGMLIGWDIVSRSFRARWWILLALLLVGYVAVDALSNRDPVTVFIAYATFNPQTGYDRKLQWDVGTAQVALTPIFGIGFNEWTTAPEWWHNRSLDNFWLVIAMCYGLPAVTLLLGVVLTTIIRVSRPAPPALRRVRTGWTVSFIGLSVAALTVHLWGSAFMLFAFLLGIGVSLSHFRPPPAARLKPVGNHRPERAST
jgi:hypothetical protein